MAELNGAGEKPFQGFLLKWTNYIKGYQKRWFLLRNGMLSYYRSQNESHHTCRGSINLANAFIHTEDSHLIVISNGSTQFHLKAPNEIDRQRWITALELQKHQAIRKEEEREEEDERVQGQQVDVPTMCREQSIKVDHMTDCYQLMTKNGQALQSSLVTLEQAIANGTLNDTFIGPIRDRLQVFKLTTSALVNVASEFVQLTRQNSALWMRAYEMERMRRIRSEEMVEQLARQQQQLERRARDVVCSKCLLSTSNSRPHTRESVSSDHGDSDSEDQFFDAMQGSEAEVIEIDITPTPTQGPGAVSRRADSNAETDQDSEGETEHPRVRSADTDHRNIVKVHVPSVVTGEGRKVSTSHPPSSVVKKRRTEIPVRPDVPLNIWSFLRNSIGKDLSKIPLPVNFNEPISMLQRIAEEMEYSDCLDKAAECSDLHQQMAYVAAFTISAYGATDNRTTKPFNPLLGETFECDRTDDYGWRFVAEQVSHHPPVAATHVQGRGWKMWQEFAISSKFKGQYLNVVPLGIAHVVFQSSGNHYTWKKVNSTIHNMIVGRLWIDHHGEMDITNHITKDVCRLKYKQYSYFTRDRQRQVTGVVTNKSGEARWVIRGHWDEGIDGAPVVSNSSKAISEATEFTPLWRRNPIAPGAEEQYNFTLLARQLNEAEPLVAPTDSRLRPDQRAMENNDWEVANVEKSRLEDKQRVARRQREAEAEQLQTKGLKYPEYEPLWFKKGKDDLSGMIIHHFTDEYWACKEKRDFSRCPDIF